jgi:hypothetical protein
MHTIIDCLEHKHWRLQSKLGEANNGRAYPEEQVRRLERVQELKNWNEELHVRYSRRSSRYWRFSAWLRESYYNF